MRKRISFALAIMLLFVALCAAFAEAPVTRSSNYFHSYGITVGDGGGGTLQISFNCVGMGICSTIGLASYEVEVQDDDGNWESASGWLDGQTGTNMASYACYRTFSGQAGKTYRVNAVYIAVLNGGAETKTITSNSMTLK